ncbi:zinc-binding dehydrogenase [Salinispora oceanensis]|uniref:zinc-binding dehydrogenase n=1 Tax=Salinispora oceanensis TaxID=1050199 RepID=UPI00036E1AD1|nr:zinc-binding dehydrogenase [Salinispora oceanensis]
MAGAAVRANLKGPGNCVDGRRPQRALAGPAGRQPAVTVPVRTVFGPSARSAGAVPGELALPLRSRSRTAIFSQRSRDRLAELVELYDRGELRIEVSGRYPLRRAADAHREMEGGHVHGKIVINPI